MEERHVRAERAEAEALRAAGHGRDRRPGERIRVERPEKDADVLHVVAAQPGRKRSRRREDAAHVDLVRDRVEAGVDNSPASSAQIGGVVVVRANVVADALRRRQHFKELNRMRAPPCGVARQLFKHRHRALAPPKSDRVRDLRPRAVHSEGNAVDLLVPNQVPDVRYHPGRARLDKQIVVELRHVLFQNGGLFLHNREKRLQRPDLVARVRGDLRVAQAIQGRQKIKEVERTVTGVLMTSSPA